MITDNGNCPECGYIHPPVANGECPLAKESKLENDRANDPRLITWSQAIQTKVNQVWKSLPLESREDFSKQIYSNIESFWIKTSK